MKRVLLLLTASLLLAIAGQPAQASQKSAKATISTAKQLTDGYWSGYWTWDPVHRVWYWTWVYVGNASGHQTS